MNKSCAAILVLSLISACDDSARLAPKETSSRKDVPAAPEGLTAVPGDTFVDLSWNAQTDVEGYAVFRSQDPDGDFVQIGASLSTQLRDPLAVPGTAYVYLVRSRRGFSLGEASTGVKTLTLPSPPSGLTATPSGASVILNWQAVASAERYDVFRSTNAGGTFSSVGTSTATTFTDVNAPTTQVVFYTVRALNASGQSKPSAEVSPGTLLAAPTNISLTASGTQITVAWSPVTHATSYTVMRSTTSGGPYAAVGSPTASPFSDTGLAPNTAYFYVVRAVLADRTGPGSGEQSLVTPPAPPSGLALSTQQDEVAVQWNASPGAISYTVFRRAADATAWAAVGTVVTPHLVDAGLAPNASFSYVVRANGTSGASGDSLPQTILTPPAAPVVASRISHTTVELSWPPSAGATSYRILRGASVTTLTQIATQTGVNFQDTGLTPFTTYVYAVVAENGNGDGARTTLSVTPGLVAPTNVRVVGGAQSVHIRWDPVRGATGYSILRSLTSGMGYAQIATAADTFYISTGLAPGTTYYFIVQAHDGTTGESVGSAEVSTATLTGRQLCVLNTAATGEVIVFDTAATGDVAPLRSFGATAGLVSPRGFDVDMVHNEAVMTSATGFAAIFATHATATSAPLRLLAGPATELGALHGAGFDPERNELYVSSGNEVLVFPRTATTTAPLRRWTETAENLLVSRLRDEVLTTQAQRIATWTKASTGAALPIRTYTQFGDDVFLDEVNNELVLVNSASILFYRPQTLEFLREMIFSFTSPGGVMVDTLTDQVIVSDRGANQLLFFQRGFEGDVTPVRTIAGPLTQLNAPGRLRFCQ